MVMRRMRVRSRAHIKTASKAASETAAEAEAVSAAGPARPPDELASCCPDLDEWPMSWRYEERDVAPGRGMVECFKPFLRHLLGLGLSGKTLRRHRDNLWL